MFNNLEKKSLNVSLFLPALFSLLVAAAPASATSYTLTVDGCTGSCGTAPFGTVDVVQDGTNTVKLTASLSSGDKFVSTGFPGSFGFDVIGDPTITVSNLTAGWSLLSKTSGDLHFGAFGNVDYALVCNVCGSGASNPFVAPISFDVTASGLTPASFAELSRIPPGSTRAYFVADIQGTTGNTGIVGAITATSNAPEPGGFLLCGLGTLMVVFGLLPRRKLAQLRSALSEMSEIFPRFDTRLDEESETVLVV